MKKNLLIIGGIFGVIVIGILFYIILGNNTGIIGGSDGLTSIIVSDKASLDEKVGASIIANSQGKYLDGETVAEGHIILGSKKTIGKTKVYALTMYGEYGFQDNNFVKVAGTGVIPAVITISKETKDSFSSEIEWPDDGTGYESSIKNMFPEEYHNRILKINATDEQNIKNMEIKYAEEYLNKIGRKARIGEYGDFAHPLLTQMGVSTEVSNKLLEKNYQNYPMWVGNQEKIEDGIRYVYEMIYNKQQNQISLLKYNYENKKIAEMIIIDSLTGNEI